MSARWSPALLLAAAVLLSVNTFAEQPAPRAFTKEAMLRDTVNQVIVPAYEELHLKCRELTNAVSHVVAQPNAATLEKARVAWRDAVQSASRIRCFQMGPIAEHDFVSSFYHWQIFPLRIKNVLNSTRAIDQAFVDDLGATTKGLFALEFFLFDPVGDRPAGSSALDSFTSVRAREFMVALAKDLEAKAAKIAGDWRNAGEESAAPKFIKAGQDSVNVLVNQLAMSLEDTAERHLNFILSLRPPVLAQLDRIERSRSGTSREGVITALEGAQRVYRGGEGLGLDDAVRQQNPALAKRIDEQFDLALAAVRSLAAPLESVVVTNRVSLEGAYEKARALEVLFKVDLASTLGVTLTFSSADGD